MLELRQPRHKDHVLAVPDTLESVTKATLSKVTLSREDTPLEGTQILGSKYPRTHVIIPLTKGHLSNTDRIVWQKGCPY